MGFWKFWSRKKTGAANSRTRRVASTTEDQHANAWMWARIAGWAVFVIALAGGWYGGEQYLLNYVGQQQAQSQTPTVVIANAPAWMSDGLRDELSAIVAAPLSDDPMDHDSLVHAKQALESAPWVRQVARLERLGDGQVRVQAQFRAPAALVGWRDDYRLVDHSGVLLPGVYEQQQVALVGLPVIRGVRRAPGVAGQLWEGEDLQAGLSLARLVSTQPFASQVMMYDVSERDRRGRVRLVMYTHQRGEVVWGMPPGQEGAIEPDAETKLRWLANVYEQRGQVDAGGKVVSVYSGTVFIHNREGDFIVPGSYTSTQ